MKETIHYLLMANHHQFKKELFARLKDTDMTLGQPKVLDYLIDHDGAVQKEISAIAHIEPASLTSILRRMEERGLIHREMHEGDRRALTVWMTEKGRECAQRVKAEFDQIERSALSGFSHEEAETLRNLLLRLSENRFQDME